MTPLILLAVIYFAFISLGLPDSVLGVAWPAMRSELSLPIEAAGLITLVLTACAAVSSFFSAGLLKRFGAGGVVTISGWLTGLALLGFSFGPSYALMLLLAVPLGLGAGAVDAGLNHFVARHYSSRHMNWLHGCWGVGATLGPILMGSALASAGGWTQGYRVIAIIQLTLSMLFLLTLPLWRSSPEIAHTDDAHGAALSRKPTVAMATWLAPSLFLFYAAVEVGTGLWAASVLTGDRHVDLPTAGVWVSCFFGAITFGRFAAGLVSQRLGNRGLVRYGMVVAIVGTVLFSLPSLPASVSLVGLMLMGLGCAPVFPSLMHEAAARFEPALAAKVIGRQVGFAYLGGALIPASLGLLAGVFGVGAIMPMIVLAAITLLVLSEWLNSMT
jgi:fucose permease